MTEIPTQGLDPTFLNLKNHLASMLGADEVSALPTNDAARIGIYVNQAYRECYAPIDGYRPGWATDNIGINLPEPAALELDLTNGSVGVQSNVAIPSKYAGSLIQIGADFYMLASTDDAVEITLVTPWSGTTANNVGATMYHNSHELDREVIDVEASPELIGYGPMSPINSPEAATRLRGNFSTDFIPSKLYGNVPSMTFNKTSIETDKTPLFYYIDNSRIATPINSSNLQSEDFMAVRPRFNVFPLPSAAISIRVKANVLPHELTNAADLARLPGNAVWDLLYPIACAKLALADPRYNGGNTEAILRNAEEARKRLSSLARPQKQRTIRLRKRLGW